jgi:hypothetical protein
MVYNTNAPRGFVPTRRIDGACASFAMNAYTIASGYATAIGKGDPVISLNDGTIGIGVAGSQVRGVLWGGVEYTDTSGNFIQRPNWVASTTAKAGTTVKAYIIDDPNIVFTIQETDGSSGAGTALALTDVGLNINFVIGAPNTLGDSTTSINNTTEDTTATLNCKILGLTDHPENAVGDYANLDVVFNAHQLKSVGTAGI